MASTNEDKKSFSKCQHKQTQATSKVNFDLDGSQHIDDPDELLDEVDEFLELSLLSHNPSSSSIDSTNNGTVLHTRIPANYENKLTTKRCTR
jgi:hypothetical protein